jgi:hypothetical protein
MGAKQMASSSLIPPSVFQHVPLAHIQVAPGQIQPNNKDAPKKAQQAPPAKYM